MFVPCFVLLRVKCICIGFTRWHEHHIQLHDRCMILLPLECRTSLPLLGLPHNIAAAKHGFRRPCRSMHIVFLDSWCYASVQPVFVRACSYCYGPWVWSMFFQVKRWSEQCILVVWRFPFHHFWVGEDCVPQLLVDSLMLQLRHQEYQEKLERTGDPVDGEALDRDTPK